MGSYIQANLSLTQCNTVHKPYKIWHIQNVPTLPKTGGKAWFPRFAQAWALFTLVWWVPISKQTSLSLSVTLSTNLTRFGIFKMYQHYQKQEARPHFQDSLKHESYKFIVPKLNLRKNFADSDAATPKVEVPKLTTTIIWTPIFE